MKSFTPYDPRIRLDAVSYKKIRDIQKWTGQKLNTETVRNSIDLYWNLLESSEREHKNASLDLGIERAAIKFGVKVNKK
jgi:hypothetical protein